MSTTKVLCTHCHKNMVTVLTSFIPLSQNENSPDPIIYKKDPIQYVNNPPVQYVNNSPVQYVNNPPVQLVSTDPPTQYLNADLKRPQFIIQVGGYRNLKGSGINYICYGVCLIIFFLLTIFGFIGAGELLSEAKIYNSSATSTGISLLKASMAFSIIMNCFNLIVIILVVLGVILNLALPMKIGKIILQLELVCFTLSIILLFAFIGVFASQFPEGFEIIFLDWCVAYLIVFYIPICILYCYLIDQTRNLQWYGEQAGLFYNKNRLHQMPLGSPVMNPV